MADLNLDFLRRVKLSTASDLVTGIRHRQRKAAVGQYCRSEPGHPPGDQGDVDPFQNHIHDPLRATPLTRRRVLQLGVGAGAGGLVPPWIRLMEFLGTDPFTLRVGSDRFALVFRDGVSWSLDAARFGGKPQLIARNDGQRISIQLINAFLPGTALRADLAASIFQQGSTWWATLSLPHWNLRLDGPLRSWLAGTDAMERTVDLRRSAALSADHVGLRLGGRMKATFSPDWQLQLSGDRIAELDVNGSRLCSDSLVLGLPADDGPILTSDSGSRRTLLRAERGGRQTWMLHPALDLPGTAGVRWDDEPFSHALLESVEANGETRHTIVLTRDDQPPSQSGQPRAQLLSRPQAWLALDERLTTPDASQFTMSLAGVRYALSCDSDGCSEWLAANIDGSASLYLPGVSAHLSGQVRQAGDNQPLPFELAQRDGHRTSIRCQPTFAGADAPLEGTSARFEPPASPHGITVRWDLSDAATDGRDADTGLLSLDDEAVTLKLASVAPLTVLRHEDFLSLRLEFVNLELVATGGVIPVQPRRLQRVDANQSAYVVVILPGQHVAEGVQEETGDNSPKAAYPVPAALAAESRLAFQLIEGDNGDGLAYTLTDLLAWRNPPSPTQTGSHLVPAERTTPVGTKPTAIETAIEAPYRLVLAPNSPENSAWDHATMPVTSLGITELWRTRLGTPTGSGSLSDPFGIDVSHPPQLRATYARPVSSQDPYPAGLKDVVVVNGVTVPRAWSSLSSGDRDDIVDICKDPTGLIEPSVFMLSAWGASFAVALQNPDLTETLESWVHRANFGRDTFVRIVKRGYLLPFGHAAAKIEVTERKMQPATNDHLVAMLRRRTFIVVRQPEVTNVGLSASEQRSLPFRRVRILNLVTPPLVMVDVLMADTSSSLNPAIWLQVDQVGPVRDLMFAISAEDHAGRKVTFDSPMAWASAEHSRRAGVAIANAYNAATESRRRRAIGGQVLTFADEGAAASRPSHSTADILLQTAWVQNRFASRMQEARVGIDQLSKLSSRPGPFKIRFAARYLRDGFEPAANPDELYALLDNVSAVDLSGPNRGGVVITPVINPSQLSRRYGLTAGASDTLFSMADSTAEESVAGGLDLNQFLDDKAAILGVQLSKLLNLIGVEGDHAPKITSGYDWGYKFSVDLSFVSELDVKTISEKLRDEFDDNNEDLGDGAMVFVVQPGSRWLIKWTTDDVTGAESTYLVDKDAQTQMLRVYDMNRDCLVIKVEWAPKLNASGSYGPLKFNQPTSINPPPIKITAEICSTVNVDIEVDLSGTGAEARGNEIATGTAIGYSDEPARVARALADVSIDGSVKSTIETTGELRNFEINVLIVTVAFDKLFFKYSSEDGSKFDAKVKEVTFTGPLQFVNGIRKLFGSGAGGLLEPIIELDFQHVGAGLAINLPKFAIGVFSISNIKIINKVLLPFNGDPISLMSGINERQNPFQLSVMIFMGEGHFGMALNVRDNLHMLEMSLGFGLKGAFGIGPLTAEASVAVGIYYQLIRQAGQANEVTLVGYLRAKGSVSLFVASVSLEIYLALTYRLVGTESGVEGEARITLRVQLLFFSFSISATAKKRFSGSSTTSELIDDLWTEPDGAMATEATLQASRPRLADVMPAPDWTTYCQAFV